MTLTMKSTRKGAEKGTVVKNYEAGKTYEVSDELGKVFIAEGWASAPRAVTAKITEKSESPADKK